MEVKFSNFKINSFNNQSVNRVQQPQNRQIFKQNFDTVSFGSIDRTSPNFYNFETGEVKNTTYLFREGIDWDNFAQNLDSHFWDKKHVNIVSHGCSDGSEAYSIAIMLLEKLGEERAQKFLPILARDIDDEVIDFAKSGYIRLANDDLEELGNKHIDPNKYFKRSRRFKRLKNDSHAKETRLYKVNKKLKSAVSFEKGNVLNHLRNFKDDSNTVLFFRNAVPYLSRYEKEIFYKSLKEKLMPGSILVLGTFDFDNTGEVVDKLVDAQLIPIFDENCMLTKDSRALDQNDDLNQDFLQQFLTYRRNKYALHRAFD